MTIDVTKIRKIIKLEGKFTVISKDKIIADNLHTIARMEINVFHEPPATLLDSHSYIVDYKYVSFDEYNCRCSELPSGIFRISKGFIYNQTSRIIQKMNIADVICPPMSVTMADYLLELMDALITASIM